jgi:hypothetical protein
MRKTIAGLTVVVALAAAAVAQATAAQNKVAKGWITALCHSNRSLPCKKVYTPKVRSHPGLYTNRYEGKFDSKFGGKTVHNYACMDVTQEQGQRATPGWSQLGRCPA